MSPGTISWGTQSGGRLQVGGGAADGAGTGGVVVGGRSGDGSDGGSGVPLGMTWGAVGEAVGQGEI